MLERERSGAVIVQRGGIAVIERRRSGVTYFVLPGGGVEPAEDIEAAARREVLEELGVDVTIDGLVATVDFVHAGRVSRQRYFAATVVGGEFGTGSGPEFRPSVDAHRGTYLPRWLDLAEAVAFGVRPSAVVCAVLARGVDDLLSDPLSVVEHARSDRPPGPEGRAGYRSPPKWKGTAGGQTDLVEERASFRHRALVFLGSRSDRERRVVPPEEEAAIVSEELPRL